MKRLIKPDYMCSIYSDCQYDIVGPTLPYFYWTSSTRKPRAPSLRAPVACEAARSLFQIFPDGTPLLQVAPLAAVRQELLEQHLVPLLELELLLALHLELALLSEEVLQQVLHGGCGAPSGGGCARCFEDARRALQRVV